MSKSAHRIGTATRLRSKGTGLTARCFCHEIDHLDGVLFTDRATHMYTDEEMEELYGGDDKE